MSRLNNSLVLSLCFSTSLSEDTMTNKSQKEWSRQIDQARRLQMANSLADRHAEGDKMKVLVEQLEQQGREQGWKEPTRH